MPWLRMIAECELDKKDKIGKLWKEVQELTFIFGKIISSMK